MKGRNKTPTMAFLSWLAVALSFEPVRSACAADVLTGVRVGTAWAQQRSTNPSVDETASDGGIDLGASLQVVEGRWGIGLRYDYVPLSLFAFDVDRHAVEGNLSFAYPLWASGTAHAFVQPSVGLRADVQRASHTDGPEFNVFSGPVGVTLGWGEDRTFTEDTDALHFLTSVTATAEIFPYSVVEVTNRVGGQSDLRGFGGFALEAGVSESLLDLTGLPLGVAVNYRYQNVARSAPNVRFDETLQTVSLRLSYAALEVW